MKNQTRCSWLNLNNETYIKYHDEEWGRPLYDDRKLYELLILESFQAGLSWECVLNKRENFRAAFDNFDIDKIVQYDEKKQQELLNNPKIIRNRLKIKAAINNSIVFKSIQEEYGSFSNYIWSFTDNKVVFEEFTERTTSPLSDAISKDLKKRGMTFVGSTIIYSFLQSMGVINGHSRDCMCYGKRKPMNIVTRGYQEKDLSEMIKIWNEIVEDGIAFPQEDLLSLESGVDFFASQTYTGVAVDAETEKVCGLYILHPNNIGRCGHICNASYAVSSESRGMHIGEKLVLDCMEQGRLHGFGVLQFNAVVATNVHARHLYERLGFIQLGTIPKGFRMKDGHYEDICPYYRTL